MSTFTSSTCLQFAIDTTLYKRCKVKYIPDCANIIQNDVEHLKAWSDVNSLLFNETKTKTMIFSTKQMGRYHQETQIHLEELKSSKYMIRAQSRYFRRHFLNKTDESIPSTRQCRYLFSCIKWK